MASTANTTNPVLKAHAVSINGCIALEPAVDDAIVRLEHAHAVLLLAMQADEDGVLNRKIIRGGYAAAEEMLAQGFRELVVGYEVLYERTRTRQ